MTENALELWPEIFAVLAGVIVIFLFALTIAISHRVKTQPGSSGHRPKDEDEGHEEIRPDGYIDSFAGTIEEAGGIKQIIIEAGKEVKDIKKQINEGDELRENAEE